MIKVIFQIIYWVFTGICTGIYAFLKVLPIYEQLSSFKEELIAAVIGVPAIVVSLCLFIPKAIKFLKDI